MEPFSIAMLVASIAGTGIKMYQASQANKANQAEAQRNQALAAAAARDAVARGQQASENMALEQGRQRGAQVAAYGASGVSASSGSPLNVLMGTDALMQQDRRTLEDNAQREAWSLKNQGAQIAAQAKLDSQSYMYGQVGSLLGGASDAAAKGYQVWKEYKKT